MNPESHQLSSVKPQSTTFETSLNLPGARKGKVRDIYSLPELSNPETTSELGDGSALLMIATDRISAFDVVLPTPIPGKGRVLTSIASFWLRWIETEGICGTHLISTDDGLVPDQALTTTTTRSHLSGRSTISRRCEVIPVECVVRGYLEGSGLKDYQRSGSVCGVQLPVGLMQCDQLPAPIFTPATKADEGHDENIGFDQASEHISELGGGDLMKTLRDRSIAIYTRAAEYARRRGIILADTKFEFGLQIDRDGQILDRDPIVIDEALTPDSSRFWPADSYEPGHAQQSFDKQFVREYLQSLVDGGAWDKTPPGPDLPEEVVRGTLERYKQALRMLTE